MSYSATPLNAFVSRPPVTGTPVATAPAVNTVSLPNIAPATNTAPPATQTLPPVIRGQTTPNQLRRPNSVSAGSDDHMRLPMLPVGEPVLRGQDSPFAAQMQPGYNQSPVERLAQQPLPPNAQFPGVLPPGNADPLAGPVEPLPPTVDFDVFVEETRTGRFMFGMGVNSDLGVTGQIVIDERNFDWRRPPSSWQDFVNGTAWRGGGQGFRMEAAPGTRVQRYLITFTQPYLYLGSVATPFSLNLSGFYYDRRYFDWDEQRLGGRVALGYRLAPDLSLSGAIRAENVNIHDPRVIELVPELDRVIGDNDLYSGRTTLTYDTRDTPFAATQGHLIKLGYEQVFGSFDYPRGDIDYRQYFRVRERPDGSGRHTLAYAFQFGFSGEETPIFENYFAGGFSTMRGFDFRGASPVGAAGVTVGGRFQFLGSVEYMFPLTADDMVKGVVFCDYGTVERDIEINADNYRVSPGFGLRIAIPAMGPAPLALDLAFPVEHAPTDDVQNFSFFFGFGR
ncbi:MAG: hypothetical protein CMJ64_20805 [Planctomycetaceae bacterium]|nr:hypothetical protein [Planctomycetaceae bacterium]